MVDKKITKLQGVVLANQLAELRLVVFLLRPYFASNDSMTIHSVLIVSVSLPSIQNTYCHSYTATDIALRCAIQKKHRLI
jgi:hypothetical protein